MGQFAVLKEVYTINDGCDESDKNIVDSIDNFDPLHSNLPPPWTMSPQVSITFSIVIIYWFFF